MTISSNVRKAGPFTGNNIATAFPFTFKVFAASDVQVVRAFAGIESVLVLNTDYTVSLNGNQNTNPGGTVTLSAPLATGQTLVLTSAIENLQPTDLTNQGGFYPRVINDALDRATIQIQQLDEKVDRALRVAVTTSSNVNPELPPPLANNLIGWNETASGLTNLTAQNLATIVAYGTVNADVFTGDGVTTLFILSNDPGALNNLDVAISGVTQLPGVDYNWSSGLNLTFTTPPPVAASVLVRYAQSLPSGAVSDGAVSTTKLADGAVTTVKIANGAVTAAKIDAAFDATLVKTNTAQTITGSKRGSVTTDNDLSFNMNDGNNFSCTTSGSGTLTFTNITAGQSGFILLVNASNHTISAAATTKITAGDLAKISATGSYILSYFAVGSNVYVTASGNVA
jgi:hypothetical protein